jgi:drug/metabolite transporter (DMT)-like permease
VIVLGEPLTTGTLFGFPLVLLGSFWATRAPTRSDTDAEPPTRRQAQSAS